MSERETETTVPDHSDHQVAQDKWRQIIGNGAGRLVEVTHVYKPKFCERDWMHMPDPPVVYHVVFEVLADREGGKVLP